MGGRPLNGQVVGISPAADGYYLAGSDGGIFSFGNAPFTGSFVGVSASPVIDVDGFDGSCVGTTEPIWDSVVVTLDGTLYMGPMPSVRCDWTQLSVRGARGPECVPGREPVAESALPAPAGATPPSDS